MPESHEFTGGRPSAESRPAELLLDAVEAMPAADRRRVLLWLLESRPQPAPSPWTMQPLWRNPAARSSQLPPPELESLISRFTALRGQHQVVPVRLETDRYERLREWCNENNFSMAVVIRGLLARFLDEQQPVPARAEPAGQPEPASPAEQAAESALDAAAGEAVARAEEEGRPG